MTMDEGIIDVAARLQQLEDENRILKYVILMHYGGMNLVGEYLEREPRTDLIPRIKQALKQDEDWVVSMCF